MTGALAIVAILAGSFAASAEAKVIALPLHGTIALAGSSVRCGAGLSSGLVFIDCGISDTKGQPKRGGYVAVMAENGRVSVIATTTTKTVFSRAPAARLQRGAANSPAISVHAGDVISIPKVPAISCTINSLGGKPTVLCYYVDKHGLVRPGSYSFGMSGLVMTTLAWNKARKEHLAGSWPENG
jgi:hypothetical protein